MGSLLRSRLCDTYYSLMNSVAILARAQYHCPRVLACLHSFVFSSSIISGRSIIRVETVVETRIVGAGAAPDAQRFSIADQKPTRALSSQGVDSNYLIDSRRICVCAMAIIVAARGVPCQVLFGLEALDRGGAYEGHTLLIRLRGPRWICLDTAGDVACYELREPMRTGCVSLLPNGRVSLFPVWGPPFLGTWPIAGEAVERFRARARQLAATLGYIMWARHAAINLDAIDPRWESVFEYLCRRVVEILRAVRRFSEFPEYIGSRASDLETMMRHASFTGTFAFLAEFDRQLACFQRNEGL